MGDPPDSIDTHWASCLTSKRERTALPISEKGRLGEEPRRASRKLFPEEETITALPTF